MSDAPTNSGDRLGLTVAFAIMVHAVIVLGVTFRSGLLQEPEEPLPSLDVILVQKQSPDAPDEADFLAQADQQGGGTKEEAVRPTAPLTGPALKPETGLAPEPSQAAAPDPVPEQPTDVLTTEQSEQSTEQEQPREEEPERELPHADELMKQATEVARLEAELSQDIEAYSKRAKHKYISANTREYLYASYMQAWVDKVERIGNLNYPDEARRKGLSGELVLDVAINHDGSVESVRVLESSRHPVLDKAAVRIVRLAAPFAPLPPAIREKVDVLHITRTWQFTRGMGLDTR